MERQKRPSPRKIQKRGGIKTREENERKQKKGKEGEGEEPAKVPLTTPMQK